jgi:hypothetical protein
MIIKKDKAESYAATIIYEQQRTLSDILGANAIDTPARTIKVQSGQQSTMPPNQNWLNIGSVLVTDGTGIYVLASATNWPATHNLGVGILTEIIITGFADPNDQVSATIFEGGSFRKEMLLTNPADPVNLNAMRDFLHIHGILLEGQDAI